jgi:hypothetical protein
MSDIEQHDLLMGQPIAHQLFSQVPDENVAPSLDAIFGPSVSTRPPVQPLPPVQPPIQPIPPTQPPIQPIPPAQPPVQPIPPVSPQISPARNAAGQRTGNPQPVRNIHRIARELNRHNPDLLWCTHSRHWVLAALFGDLATCITCRDRSRVHQRTRGGHRHEHHPARHPNPVDANLIWCTKGTHWVPTADFGLLRTCERCLELTRVTRRARDEQRQAQARDAELNHELGQMNDQPSQLPPPHFHHAYFQRNLHCLEC